MKTILQQDIDYIFDKLIERDVYRDSSILITGCAGFLGYYFMQFFVRKSVELGIKKVIGLDNFMLRQPEWIDSLQKEFSDVVDVRTFDIISDNIADVQGADECDFVIHMASIASPVFYRKYPIQTLDANITGLRRLLDYYVNKELKGLLFFSSSEIYGDPAAEFIPTDEEYRGNVSAIGPRACYDEAKRFGETMCYLFNLEYGIPTVIVRPFNNYGPGMSIDDKRVPADFAKAVFNGEDIVMLSDGTPTRTFCYVADAVYGYLSALAKGKFDYFNIGIDKPEIMIRELADIYVQAGRDIFGYKGKAVYAEADETDYLTHNPNRRCPVIDKARKILGYEPEIYVEEGIRRFLQNIKENGGIL